jgi:hypothetical protein
VFGGVTYLSAVLGRAVRGASGALVTALSGAGATLGVVFVTARTGSLPVALVTALAALGLVVLVSRGLRSGGAYSAHEHNEVEIAALYWHFVDLIWILVFTFVYLI